MGEYVPGVELQPWIAKLTSIWVTIDDKTKQYSSDIKKKFHYNCDHIEANTKYCIIWGIISPYTIYRSTTWDKILIQEQTMGRMWHKLNRKIEIYFCVYSKLLYSNAEWKISKMLDFVKGHSHHLMTDSSEDENWQSWSPPPPCDFL